MDRQLFDKICGDLWENLDRTQRKHPLFCKNLLEVTGKFSKYHYERCAETFKEANDSTPVEEVTGENVINEELMEMFSEIAGKNYKGAYLEGLDVAVTIFRAIEWIYKKNPRKEP